MSIFVYGDYQLVVEVSLSKLIGAKNEVIFFWPRARELSRWFWDALMRRAIVSLIVIVFHVSISSRG